ncbi:MAG: hypothetical protein LBI13_06660 [Streptococcaceae bacterium]|jgi:multisubunit Na+/H+ antiporter MnhC subunit|nr:hypothetical protein [Streptococcaceae bacterium]
MEQQKLPIDSNEKTVLGVLAIVFGGIGLFFSWIPIINILSTPLAVAGAILGVIGISLNLKRKKVKSIIGTALSVAAIFIMVIEYGAISKSISNSSLTTQSSSYDSASDYSTDTSSSSEDTNFSSSSSSTVTSSSSTAVETSDAKQWLADYQAFADSYSSFVDKYLADPTDLTLLSEGADMATKESQMLDDAQTYQSDFTGADLVTYTKITNEITTAAAKLAAAQ